jgi:hypothetical protein
MINAGIERIVYKEPYRMDSRAINLLGAAGIRYERIGGPQPIDEDPYDKARRLISEGVTLSKVASKRNQTFVLQRFTTLPDGNVQLQRGSRQKGGFNGAVETEDLFSGKPRILYQEYALEEFIFYMNQGFKVDKSS